MMMNQTDNIKFSAQYAQTKKSRWTFCKNFIPIQSLRLGNLVEVISLFHILTIKVYLILQ
jgi:hypothetical protein